MSKRLLTTEEAFWKRGQRITRSPVALFLAPSVSVFLAICCCRFCIALQHCPFFQDKFLLRETNKETLTFRLKHLRLSFVSGHSSFKLSPVVHCLPKWQTAASENLKHNHLHSCLCVMYLESWHWLWRRNMEFRSDLLLFTYTYILIVVTSHNVMNELTKQQQGHLFSACIVNVNEQLIQFGNACHSWTPPIIVKRTTLAIAK